MNALSKFTIVKMFAFNIFVSRHSSVRVILDIGFWFIPGGRLLLGLNWTALGSLYQLGPRWTFWKQEWALRRDERRRQSPLERCCLRLGKAFRLRMAPLPQCTFFALRVAIFIYHCDKIKCTFKSTDTLFCFGSLCKHQLNHIYFSYLTQIIKPHFISAWIAQ
jgi:hypothetical protein